MTSALRLTAHAVQRMGQRGLAADDLELIRCIGTEVEDGFMVCEKDFQSLDRALRLFRDRARRLVGKRLVLAGNSLVTGYHANRRKQRQLIRGSKAQSTMESYS